MNGFRNWIRNFGMKFRASLSHFMAGRYGHDKLNNAILVVGVVACLLSVFVRRVVWLYALLWLMSYGCVFWSLFRSLSRNTYKRYQENRRYLRLLDQLRDREHRYYACPRCRQSVRVPRGKGEIAIKCPKCGERFVKKT